MPKSHNNSYKKLEMNTIIDMLVDFAIIENNKNDFQTLKPTTNIEYIENMLMMTDEALTITHRFSRAPLMISRNYYITLDLAMRGGILSGQELYETIRLNTTIKANFKMLQALIKEQITCDNYQEIVESMYVIEGLDQRLNKSVDETGAILDDASPVLKNIRFKLKNIDSRIRSKINEIMAKETTKLSDSVITMRNNRYCLAIKAEYKNAIKGIVHDISGSHQTFYVEPLAVIELTSEKEQLINEEKQEIERILRSLSNEIGENEGILRSNFACIVKIDNLFARAMLAKHMNGSKPRINTKGKLDLINARHPLLKVAKVIPNNVSFGDRYQGIVITGPNTGGKTVLLKTVGLLCLMVKYGLLIPVDSASNIMIYDKIFCDIGDDQSIENNLSTFSSHMNNIVDIINNVTPNSLVLLDEVGSGTDPVEGSNLAMAILKYFVKNDISFITTTHYSSLKAFAFNSDRIVNASMEFNDQSLEPTYRLVLGVSGSSNAFNIAKRLGLDQEIIEDAEKMTITTADETRELIIKLEAQIKEITEQKLKNDLLIAENEKKQKVLDQEIKNINVRSQNILKQTQNEASELITKTRQKAEEIITELKTMQNREIKLHEIIKVKEALNEISPEPLNGYSNEYNVEEENEENLLIGQDVYIKPYDQYGIINKVLKNGKYTVSIGNINANFERSDLKLVKPTKTATRKNANHPVIEYSKTTIKLTLDLRGCRYEEARDLIDKYIDDLVCSNIKQATIIHGYGTGVIRELVQNYLKNSPHISSYRYGGEGEGGFGVTVITLK